MKVVTPEEMSRIENLAYAAGHGEKDFMERAGRGVADYVDSLVAREDLSYKVVLLCGKGNNAGDAYVAGRLLSQEGYTVHALQVGEVEDMGPLAKEQARAFKKHGGTLSSIHEGSAVDFGEASVAVDGLFGTGFHGPAEGVFAQLIDAVNKASLMRVAIDIPSGLDGATGKALGPCIKADMTVTLGLPKRGLFFQEGWNHTGELYVADFGLPEEVIAEADSSLELTAAEDIVEKRPVIRRNRHKYQAGYVVALAGSPGMPGAAILSSAAAMKTGAGIVKLLHPDGMQAELAGSPVEVIKVPYVTRDLDGIHQLMQGASACLAGPGLARSPGTKVVVNTIIPQLHMPCVIDADAINIMAEEGLKPPRQTVLTPHLGEMGRLLGMQNRGAIDAAFIERCRAFAEGNDITLVLKGGPTFVMHPGQKPQICGRGSPGMATAGSGDVLTGIIASLLAQGMGTADAAIAGVHLHAVAGELAAADLTPYCMMASDLIDYLPAAFKEVYALT